MKPGESRSNEAGPAGKARKPAGSSKQKGQLIVLGVLSLLLVAVLGMQFTGDETEYEVAALASNAMVAPVDTETSEAVEVQQAPRARDNPVLSQSPPAEGPTRNPFENFWSQESEGSPGVQRLPPPQVSLGMTMPGNTRPLAIIDGRLHFVGQDVQGWKLAEIRPRAVVLQSPAEERLVIEMPVQLRAVVIPPGNTP